MVFNSQCVGGFSHLATLSAFGLRQPPAPWRSVSLFINLITKGGGVLCVILIIIKWILTHSVYKRYHQGFTIYLILGTIENFVIYLKSIYDFLNFILKYVTFFFQEIKKILLVIMLSTKFSSTLYNETNFDSIGSALWFCAWELQKVRERDHRWQRTALGEPWIFRHSKHCKKKCWIKCVIQRTNNAMKTNSSFGMLCLSIQFLTWTCFIVFIEVYVRGWIHFEINWRLSSSFSSIDVYSERCSSQLNMVLAQLVSADGSAIFHELINR